MSWVVILASFFLQLANLIKRFLYRHGFLRSTKLDQPVISVGNISFGGRGKTPLVIAIAQYLAQHGLKVAILSRGYKRSRQNLPTPILVEETTSVDDVGDEPFLIYKKTQAWVVVDPQRLRAAQWLLKHHQPDIFIIDDGFTHLKLQRDRDIVAVSDTDFNFLSMRRECRRALFHAHHLVTFDPILAKKQPTIDFLPRHPQYFIDHNDQKLPLHHFSGKNICLVTAIAEPERVEIDLRNLGIHVAKKYFFRDHHYFSSPMLQDLTLQCQRGDFSAIVITEKDAVKIPTLSQHFYILTNEIELSTSLQQLLLSVSAKNW